MNIRFCNDCGHVLCRGHKENCPAKKEAQSRPGYRPGYARPAAQLDRFSTANVQSGGSR